jgi:hypothetical protein
MDIASFDDLLRAARQQPEPQRLLFVFAGAELPEDSTPEERARYHAGEGGALTPLMSVDKSPGDLESFAALTEEARQFGKNWAIVFVASLSGRGGRPPSSAEVEQSLERMIASIKAGVIGTFIPFDRNGETVLLS